MTETARSKIEGPSLEPDLDALLAGDEKAFERLVTQESPRLFRIVFRILGDEEESQNIIQETFLQAFQRIKTFRRESKFTTWLYAIGINLARGSLRKSKRMTSLSDSDFDRLQPSFSKGMFVETVASWDPLRIAEQTNRHEILHRAIDRLPEDYKTIVILRDIEEHSTEEVAKMLEISGGAVRVRLHRARVALREMLNPHFQYQRQSAE
ncbi:MAG: sigma-70 family RNA polymerase sigma factor [Bacteroidetes bacterium]|nr:sigma-70 family RNA polymerase sigma factor [Bacteroidota bacterium]